MNQRPDAPSLPADATAASWQLGFPDAAAISSGKPFDSHLDSPKDSAGGRLSGNLRPGIQPIPGYTLRKPLGEGGFGEVWCAEAPGGLLKAIKFVFGARGEKRTGRELRSLELMKDVHHPFLLTLERYEFVGNRLVIVCELADGSLEDAYHRHIERGSCGIPREKLLAYLHDAADALDYLHHKFQLQHLDIKPGNLLLVGGHVKVADFGLMKDLRRENCSMIGGLTPVYAPPELFDGRPSRYSDQYSLAVMYQELLTGTRPFPGRTIAQLASQHLHNTPNLDSLPASDRPIVARALEKTPQSRFPTCLEFIDELRSAQLRNAKLKSGPGDPILSGDTETKYLSDQDSTQRSVENLPHLDSQLLGQSAAAVRETIVVAIGGMGADVLEDLKQRLDSTETAPAARVHSIAIDTDQETLYRLRLLEGPDLRAPCKVVHAGLRRPVDYRAQDMRRLRTISRRWIYNVPRNLRTEGMRPLGRLAMVDHGRQIKETLEKLIQEVAASSNHPPAVYVVGSLTGGTGSGMTLDITYLTRALLDANGLEAAEILPLLVSSTVEPQAAKPLGNADTASALQELHYYLQPGHGYPGDPGAGFPSVPAARSPLSNAYLLAASECFDGMSGMPETIADYIWCSHQGAAPILSAARKDSGESNQSPTPPPGNLTRSVGITMLVDDGVIDPNLIASCLVLHVLSHCLGQPNEAKQAAHGNAKRLAKRCEIHVDSLRQGWQPNGVQRQREIAQLIERASASLGRPPNSEEILPFLKPACERLQCAGPTDPEVVRRLGNLQREIAVRLQDERIDLETTIETFRLLKAKLKSDSKQVQATATFPAAGSEDVHAFINASLDYATEQGVAQRIQFLIDGIDLLEQKCLQRGRWLHQFRRELLKLTSQADHVALPESMRTHFERLATILRQRVLPTLVLEPFMAPKALTSPEELRGRTLASALDAANNLVEQHHQGQENNAHVMLSIDERVTIALQQIRPALLDFGGKQRLLLLVPSMRERDRWLPAIESKSGQPLTVLQVPNLPTTLVHEAQAIPLKEMINRMLRSLGGNHKIASRLHSRVDIDWTA